MAEKNQQQNTGSTGKTSDNLLGECDDVQLTHNGADLIISALGADTFTAELTVVSTKCRSVFSCYWDGSRWICT